MSFFSQHRAVENQEELGIQHIQQRIVNEATTGSQGRLVRLLTTYFDNGGGLQHPQIGNLSELAAAINVRWDANAEGRGLNLVAGLITYRLSELPVIAEVAAAAHQ